MKISCKTIGITCKSLPLISIINGLIGLVSLNVEFKGGGMGNRIFSPVHIQNVLSEKV